MLFKTLVYNVAYPDDKKCCHDVDFGSMSQNQPQNLSIDQAFQQALSLQNEKKIDESITAYRKILDEGLSETSNLTREQASAVSQNIALLYFEKKESALSYVYNQKAVFLNPGNSQANEFLKQNKNLLQITSVPRDISLTENLNQIGLKYLSVEILFSIIFILAVYVFKNCLQFFLERKKSDVLNLAIVPFRLINYFFISLLFLLTVLFIFKISDESQLRAILKTEKVTVHASSGENQASITQAEIGTIFNVLKISNDADLAYVQIKYPGAYSGWVKRSDLELLNSTKWPVFIDKK